MIGLVRITDVGRRGADHSYRVVVRLAPAAAFGIHAVRVGPTAPMRPPNQPAAAPRRRMMKPNNAARDTVLY